MTFTTNCILTASIAIAFVGSMLSASAETTRYIAPTALGAGTGTSPGNAAGYLNGSFWTGVQSSLASDAVTVRFLDGQYSSDGLTLNNLGNTANRLVLQGDTAHGAILNAPVGVMLQFNGVQNTTVKNLNFTGPITGYAFNIQGSTNAPSRNILIEDNTWIDLPQAGYGALGTSRPNVHDITVKNNEFRRVGADASAHMMYNAYGSYNIYLYDNYFEDCPGDYIRFRGNQSDFGEVVGNTFVSTNATYNRPFVAVPLFNDVDPGDEAFGTNFIINGNNFTYQAPGGTRRDPVAFYHQGFDPEGYNNLLTAAEGAILESGTTAQKKELLLTNTGINGDRIYVYDNTYQGIDRRVIFGSFASYGSVSKGWDNWADISDVVRQQALAPNPPGMPIVEYNFNEGGSRTNSNGKLYNTLLLRRWNGTNWNVADNHSPDGNGVSGMSGDHAYYDPSVTLAAGQTPGSSNSHFYGGYAGGVALSQVNEVSQLTVQGWMKMPAGKPLGTDGTASAIMGNLGSSSNDGGWVVRGQRTSTAGTLEFRVGELQSTLDHVTITSSPAAYSETDQWVFFAVTLDATTGKVQFFKGTSESTLIPAGGSTVGPLVGNKITLSDRNFYIGNSGSESLEWFQGRAFAGLLDNLRVFDRTLNMAELEAYRLADVSFSVPVIPLAGDYNFDGHVDAADYVVWRDTLGSNSMLAADGSGSGVVDQADYGIWKANFGKSADALTPAAVPEPAALWPFVFAISIALHGARLTIAGPRSKRR